MKALQTKPFWKSSTLWINAIGIVIIVLEFVLTTNLVPDPEVVALIVAILNILNRFRVTKPMDIKTLTLK